MQFRPLWRTLIAGAALAALLLSGCTPGGDATPGEDGGKLKIALSNSVISNKWRIEMVNQFESVCASEPWASEVDCSVYNSGDDVNRQAQQISNLISQRVDAIIINPSSGTGLNNVIREACDREILVIAIDSPVTEDCAHLVVSDNSDFGRIGAEWIVQQLGGQGNVLMLNGVSGKPNDTQRREAAQKVWDANPGITVVAQVDGEWDNATAQRNTASILPTLPQVDAIWGAGGSAGALKAFEAANRDLPPTTGESENGFRRYMSAQGVNGSTVEALSIGYPTYFAALGLELARLILKGEREPGGFTVPFPLVTNETLREGIDVLPDQDDDFYTSFTDTSDKPLITICAESAVSGDPCAEPPVITIPAP